jgi:glycosyltransferase 2 family protein
MAWIRGTDEPFERRPGDIARVVLGGIGVAVVGVWAQAQSSLDTNVFRTVNALPNSLEGTANALYALGSIWAVLIVAIVVALLALHKWRIVLQVVLAGIVAWAIAELLNDLLGDHSLKGLSVHVRTGSGPVFPSANLAVITALALTLSPYVVRPLRRIALVVVVFVALAAMYLGTAFPSDVLGGLLLGVAAGGVALVAFGAPGGRPSREEVHDALVGLNFDVVSVEPADGQEPLATIMDVTLASGERLRAEAFGRDQRDGQLAGRIWQRIMYREPGMPVFGSRIQHVEHIAYTLLLAGRAEIGAPELVKTGAAGDEAAMLVTRPPRGRPLGDAPAEQVTDAVLGTVWGQVRRLHEAGITHGNLDAHHIFVSDHDRVALDGFHRADVSAEENWRNRDVAAVLVTTALLVGNDRATDAAIHALGKDRIAASIPFVQPAALPSGITHGIKHQTKILKALRTDLSSATESEDVQPLQIRRLSLVNIGMLAGVVIALAIAIPGLQSINFASVQNQFSNATWGWVIAAAMIYPLIVIAWATALMGAVNADLPFVPTVLTQLACTFLNLVTPNGIGGTALQLDYLHHEGVPVASAGSAMVLSTGVGGAIQMLLLIGAAAFTSTSLNLGNGGTASLGAIALAAAAVGVVLLVPKIRGKVVPAVKKAASDIWVVLRNPVKGLRLFGGNLAGNLLYPAALGLCLLAFGHSLGFAELVVVQVGAGVLGNVAPVPGGIGVQEAALTAGLTGFGIPSAAALATVLVFRTITFVIPPIFGFVTLRWLRNKGYA